MVVGGASGIGRAVCRRFAAEGAAVAVADIDADGARAVAEEIDGLALAVDVTDAEALRRAVDDAAGRLGGLSIVMNNAASSSQTSPPVAALIGKVLCYEGITTPNNNCVGYPHSAIAFQELARVGCTTTPTQIDNLLDTAHAKRSLFMETYQNDVTCLDDGK